MEYKVEMAESKLTVKKDSSGLNINDKPVKMDYQKVSDDYLVYSGDNISKVRIHEVAGNYVRMEVNGKEVQVHVKDEVTMMLEKLGMNQSVTRSQKNLTAPMPGIILELKTSAGSEVRKGEALLILEAMKMENVIKSPVDGVIESLHVAKGDSVEKNALMIKFA